MGSFAAKTFGGKATVGLEEAGGRLVWGLGRSGDEGTKVEVSPCARWRAAHPPPGTGTIRRLPGRHEDGRSLWWTMAGHSLAMWVQDGVNGEEIFCLMVSRLHGESCC